MIAGLSAIHSAGIATLLRQLVEDLETHEVESPEQALDFVLQSRDVALVVLDLPSYDGRTLYTLKLVSAAADPAPVLAIANFRGRRDAGPQHGQRRDVYTERELAHPGPLGGASGRDLGEGGAEPDWRDARNAQ